jgi:hypothetical protein
MVFTTALTCDTVVKLFCLVVLLFLAFIEEESCLGKANLKRSWGISKRGVPYHSNDALSQLAPGGIVEWRLFGYAIFMALGVVGVYLY